VSARIYAVHHSVPIYQSSIRAHDFGRERWGQVNSFEQIVVRPPMGVGELFEDGTVYRAFQAVFLRGKSWEATEWFRRNLKLVEAGQTVWNCRTKQEWLDRLNGDVRALYESIRTHGFLEQEAIAERARSNTGDFGQFVREGYPSTVGANHEIKLGINEDGRLLFLDGRHRLAIAKLLGIERIPVRIVFVHQAFLERQPGWSSTAGERAGGPEHDSAALQHVIASHLASPLRKPSAALVRYVTFDEFAGATPSATRDNGKASAVRWEYHKSAIDFVRLCKPTTASDVLELRAKGVPIVKGSDTLDPTGKWAPSGPGAVHLHEPRNLPWPVADKRYTVLIALRVFQHLWPSQRECFLEARRVARNIVMVAPDQYPAPPQHDTSAGVTEAQLTEWNGGVPPTVSASLPGWIGKIYFWNEEALGAQ
jgi:hypothetical protein